MQRQQLATLTGILIVVSSIAPQPSAQTGVTQKYIVLYQQSAVPANASQLIADAGGALVARYDAIGVAVAQSDSASFAGNALLIDSRVEAVSATTGYATRLVTDDTSEAAGPPEGDLPNTPATDSDTLSALQWDMRQIQAPEAHAITGGSRSVLVGGLDTGIDFTHPDLAPNIDIANSVNCVSGAAVPGLAAQDDNGHGRTQRAQLPPRPTLSESSAWLRMSESPESRSETPTAISFRKRSCAGSIGRQRTGSTS